MARPKKVVPDMYWLESEKVFCVNLGGKKHRLGPDRASAEAKYREKLAEYLQARPKSTVPVPVPSPRKVSVSEAVDRYLDHAEDRVSPQQLERIRSALRPVVELFSDLPATDFGPEHLLRVRALLLEQGNRRSEGVIVAKLREILAHGPRKSQVVNTLLAGHNRSAIVAARRALSVRCYQQGNTWYQALDPQKAKRPRFKPLSQRYLAHLEGCIKSCWRWLSAPEQKLVPVAVANELASVRTPDRGNFSNPPPRLPVSNEVVEATLPHLRPLLRDLIEVVRLSGARPGEICSLTPRQISRGPNEPIAVPVGDGAVVVTGGVIDGIPVWAYAPQRHKNRRRRKPRVIALGPKVQQILAPHMEGKQPDEPIFQTGSEPGRAYTSHALKVALGRACRRAGVPSWSPYQLRHSVATLTGNEHSLEDAQAILGHSSPVMTQHYVASLFQRAARIMAKQG